jgi:hypothetical protein
MLKETLKHVEAHEVVEIIDPAVLPGVMREREAGEVRQLAPAQLGGGRTEAADQLQPTRGGRTGCRRFSRRQRPPPTPR